MTSTNNTLRGRVVLLLAGTAIAVLASAAPAVAETGSDTSAPAPPTTSGASETPRGADAKKGTTRRGGDVVFEDVQVSKEVDKASPGGL
jgi:hypothetical protein